MTDYIYVIHGMGDPVGAFTSKDKLVEYANNLKKDDGKLGSMVMIFPANSIKYEDVNHLVDYRTEETDEDAFFRYSSMNVMLKTLLGNDEE